MSIPKVAPFFPDDVPRPLAGATRRLAASVLTAASAALSRLAVSLLEPPALSVGLSPHLEFYAEADASEGALYLDGRLIGHLPGITRL